MTMDPRRLMTFRIVAHERSFSRAAEKLSLSQPSVSHQVALLETEIGLRLLDRRRGGLRLTRAGTVLLEHADHVAWRLQLADTQITGLSQERREQVRLGSFPTALAGFVPSAIARLRPAHRELRVLLSEVTASTLEPRFLSGEFDLAAGFDPRVASSTQDPIATRGLITRGLGVGWVPSLLIDDYSGVAVRPIDGAMRRRDIYALLPPGDRHPLATRVLDALVETAGEFG